MTFRLIADGAPWNLDTIKTINHALGTALPDEINGDIATHNADAAAHSAFNSIGKHKKWVPVDEMTTGVAGGAAVATMTGSARQWNVLDFDQTTAEVAFFNWSAPSSWDEGTVTFVPIWTASAGSAAEGVVWGLQGVAISNDDVISGSYSTTATSTDELIATGDLHRGPESSALTIEGTPAANDLVLFRVLRSPTSGSDTLAADARLLGYELYYNTSAAVDVA